MVDFRVTVDSVEVTARDYRWILDRRHETIRLLDAAGRQILETPARPVIVLADADGPNAAPGRLDEVTHTGDAIRLHYQGVGRTLAKGTPATEEGPATHYRLTITWRFDEAGAWTEPLLYTGAPGTDVVAVHYFCVIDPDRPADPQPALNCTHLVQPGRSGSPALGAVLDLSSKIRTDSWLGRGNCADPDRISQQWSLPSHYIAAFNLQGHPNRPGAFTRNLSGAVCLGLADVPAADVRVVTGHGRAGVVFDVRSDLWGQAGGSESQLLGARLRWSFGTDYRSAVRAYYRDLVAADVVPRKQISPRKALVATSSEYNPWGAQLAVGAEADRLDQHSLEAIYRSVRNSAMRPAMFVVDDMWEEFYGLCEHSRTRLPHFEQFLQQVRDDGLLVGLWSAFLRCSEPSLVGLEPRHLLRDRAGDPIRIAWGVAGRQHFLFDLSQPETAAVLTDRIRAFVRRYRPDLVKFDFGYELPAIDTAMPADPLWAGERLLYNSLRVVVDALRAENPDIVLMYYSLSPLYAPLVDLHSTDDIWQSVGEYPATANQRTFFASVLGELGIPTYGSGGYNWQDIEQIWFDAAASGPLGSLGSFDGDQFDTTPTDRQLAIYNGITALTRRRPHARIEALQPTLIGGSTGARSASWARYEDDRLTMVALRPQPDAEGLSHSVFPDLVTATAQLVMASRTEEDLFTSAEIGVVPLASGELDLHRRNPVQRATATIHVAGDSPQTVELVCHGNTVTVPLPVRSQGRPVERIEIAVS